MTTHLHNCSRRCLGIAAGSGPAIRADTPATPPLHSAPLQIAYDITSSASYDNLAYWIQQIKEQSSRPENMTVLLVGNKCDLQAERQVEEATAQVRTCAVGAAGLLPAACSMLHSHGLAGSGTTWGVACVFSLPGKH